MSDSDTADNTANPSAASKPPRRKRSRIWGVVWRIAKWTLLVLLILIVILVGLVAWVAGTDTGTEFAWHRVKGFMPQGIEIASVQGRLIGPLHIRGIRYDTDAMKARVKSVDFTMDASDLLSRTVHIKNLAVAGVDYKVTRVAPPKPKSNKPFSMPNAINLPVAVQIDRVAIDNVTAITAPKAKPVKLARARLIDAHLDNAKWHIKSLTATGPMFDIDANAQLTPNSGYATNLGLTAKLRLPNLAPIAARVEIKGSLKDLRLKANVDSPYNVAVNGQVQHLFSQHKSRIDARVQVNDLRTQAIRQSLPKVAVSADVQAKGPMNDLALTATSRVDSADYGKVNLDAALNYTPKTVAIHHLKLALPASGGALTAKGDVALAKSKAMNLIVNWSDLAWPLSAKPAYRSDNGRVHLTGPLSDYKLDMSLAWQVVGQTQGKLTLAGSGSTQAFDLTKLAVSGGPGQINGRAKARWSPALDVSAHLRGSHINPGAVVAKIPGDFNLAVDVTAAKKNGVLNAHVNTLTAHGSLRQQPLDLNAKLAYLGDRVKIDVLHLVTGATTANVSGLFGLKPKDKLDGQWSIHSTDLSTAMPGLAGAIQTDGHVRGSVAKPNLDATLVARNLDAYGNQVGHVGLDANVDWSGASPSKVDLAVDDVQAAGQTVNKVRLNLDGTPATHRLALDVDSAIAQANIAMVGHLDKKTYRERFTLNKLRAAYQKLAPWTLASPASGAVSAKAQSIDNACLASGDARLCITGSHDAKASVGHIKLSNFAYDYAKTFFPDGMGVTGAISGSVDASVPTGGNPRVKVDMQTTAGRVTMRNPSSGESVQVLNMAPGHIRAKMHDNGVNANVDLPLNGGSGVQANIDVAPGKGALTGHALSGRLRLSLASLSFIQKLSPQIANFDGNIQGDLRLSGTVAKPNVLGTAAVTASKIVLVAPGLTLTGVRLAAIGHGDNIGIQAAAKSGGGSLNANGNIALGGNGQTVDLHIKGNRFQMANIPEATAYVSPDLTVKVTPASVDVTGSVTIPQASVTPRNLPASGVTTVSSDQQIVSNKPAAKTEVSRAIHADVKVIFGKKVHVAAFGLKADLEGALRVVQQPGNQPTGSGAINIVNGSYKAYGQNLDIQKGKILFAGGPVSEPGLDFRAARYPNDNVTVGVQVQGTLKKPQLTLFSDPSMTQSETLSWLLLGRPLSGANGQQSSMVARAALALGSSKGSQYLQSLGNKVGLDNVGIGAPPGQGGAGKSTDTDTTALTVGKYLSPKLYIGYGLGLFNHVSTVSMRYTLSSHWTLETSSSSQSTGGDIIWQFDR